MKIELSQRDIEVALIEYISSSFGRPMVIQELDFTARRSPKELTVTIDAVPTDAVAEVNVPVVGELPQEESVEEVAVAAEVPQIQEEEDNQDLFG